MLESRRSRTLDSRSNASFSLLRFVSKSFRAVSDSSDLFRHSAACNICKILQSPSLTIKAVRILISFTMPLPSPGLLDFISILTNLKKLKLCRDRRHCMPHFHPSEDAPLSHLETSKVWRIYYAQNSKLEGYLIVADLFWRFSSSISSLLCLPEKICLLTHPFFHVVLQCSLIWSYLSNPFCDLLLLYVESACGTLNLCIQICQCKHDFLQGPLLLHKLASAERSIMEMQLTTKYIEVLSNDHYTGGPVSALDVADESIFQSIHSLSKLKSYQGNQKRTCTSWPGFQMLRSF